MGTPPDLQLPRPPGWPPWAIATSVAVHLAVLVALLLLFVPPGAPGGRHLLVSLAPQSRAVPRAMVAFPPADLGASPPLEATSPALLTEAPLREDPSRGASAPLVGSAVDSGPLSAPLGDGRAVPWPSLGSGLLWDRRSPASTIVGRTHAQLTDSAVKAIINHYLDSLAALPGGGAMLLPAWTATIAGQEYGLDGTYITVAGVKIPALLLGLIPLPVAGNESEAMNKGARMRAQDYELALPRDAAAADRREQIKAIRERNAAEQELRRKQQQTSVDP